MSAQTLWKTSVVTTPEAEEAVAEMLAAQVAPGPSSYTDAESGEVTVSVYTPEAPEAPARRIASLKAGLRRLRDCGLPTGAATIRIVKLPRADWAEVWKRHFFAREIGGALLIKPGWIKRKPKRGQKLVVLDPGLSFGTGQHPTTDYCLHELVRVVRARPAVACLDMGTGSGILAIAAAKLGCAPVAAFDYDPQCVQTARANARRNRVAHRLRITRADLTRLPRRAPQAYDLVCANLLADLLIAERDRILARVKPDGVLVVAGILQIEFARVERAYASAGWQLIRSQVRREWRSGTLVRVRAPGSRC